MKKLLAILVVATMLVSIIAMTPVMSAATADWHHPSGEGTAVIDGEKDAAYDAATVLVFDQCGTSNGSGAVLDEPAAHVYVINDNEFIYVYFDVHDTDLDNTASNNYEQDSVEIFYMKDNKKTQWRIHYDDVIDADSGDVAVLGDNVAVNVYGDGSGYAVEAKLPITDVLSNQCEILLQVDWCSGGKRDATVYASGHPEGDDGWQRDNRQTDYDCWMTLDLVGEFEDTRVDPVPEAQELTPKNYASILARQFTTQLYSQDVVSWGWVGMGVNDNIPFGSTVELTWEAVSGVTAETFTAENTKDWTSVPVFGIQVADGAMVNGEKGEYSGSWSDFTITAEGYEDVVVPGQEYTWKWTASEADWGMSGNSYAIDLASSVISQLGLTIEQFCTEYLPAVTTVTGSISFDVYNLNEYQTVVDYEAGLVALEQEWIDTDTTLAEQLEKANNALATAQGAPEDLAALENALKDANNAMNRSNKARESAGWVEGGLADTYIKETFGGIVDEIQALVDAATPAEPEPADEPTNDDTADTTAPVENNSEGGSTGLVVGIIVVIVVIVVVVAAIVLGKKKK